MVKVIRVRPYFPYPFFSLPEPRHTREKCWKLHGKPPSKDWGPQNRDKEWGKKGDNTRKGGQAHIGAATSEENRGVIQLNQDEIEQMRSFLNKLDKSTGTCSLAHSEQVLGEDDWTC
ncbi:uncharacterized protein LOC114916213 [Cajanus cajan]|uniref:uncharacterized protein LOC114916213 n=1 Tax=Cajanus cajan TaxID=3821 RepID=UPI0010FB324A|nr:uncharacterized protein LOC114916213 [Cajanus cajan]